MVEFSVYGTAEYMSCLTHFPSFQNAGLPEQFPNPFNNTPHALARQAGEQLKIFLMGMSCPHDFDAPNGGKMFGVLVVRDQNNEMAFLSGFSGMLAGKWQWPEFVPPLFDQIKRDTFLSAGEAQLADDTRQIVALQNSGEYCDVKMRLKQLMQEKKDALSVLKKAHEVSKAQRREQRKTLLEGDSRLARLSFESQQDKREHKRIKMQWCARLAVVQKKLDVFEREIDALKKYRTKLSSQLHQQVFSTYRLMNNSGEKKLISEFFENGKPPGGAGDCVAPKLLKYAHQHNLKPLALAEFWWGASPKKEIRHHGYYYPACRSKCHPILPFMLEGIKVQPSPKWVNTIDDDAPAVIYEDDDLLVVNKPHGLLAVPGKEVRDSVLIRLQKRYPEATGGLLVHRLDLSTSGLLLVAKKASIHKALQKQFLQRTIKKRYVAVLSKVLPEDQQQGVIELPLRVDLEDRPRQIVCFEHGKVAKTRWQVIERKHGQTRVYFYPVTGRTHQLRVHASHKDGLNAPIEGDQIYGVENGRLLLHAEQLIFTHPVTGEKIQVNAPVPF